MSGREGYTPGPAAGAEIRQDGEKWTLILVRDLKHPPAKVWDALTDPAQLREWAPFDADRSLGSVGPVTLSTVGTPKLQVSETRVTRADAPKLLQYQWGDNESGTGRASLESDSPWGLAGDGGPRDTLIGARAPVTAAASPASSRLHRL
jgi:uncharacterized protein YndB with AHSA1/START domain